MATKKWFRVNYDGTMSTIAQTTADDPHAQSFAAAKKELLEWARPKRDDWVNLISDIKKLRREQVEEDHAEEQGEEV